MTELRYPIAYSIDRRPEGWTADELRRDGLGGCDAVVLASILRGTPENLPHVGGKSVEIVSADGRTGETIPDTELFQVMAFIAGHLKDSAGVPEWQRLIAGAVHEGTRRILTGDPVLVCLVEPPVEVKARVELDS